MPVQEVGDPRPPRLPLVGAPAHTESMQTALSSGPPASVGLARRPVGALRQHLVKRVQSTEVAAVADMRALLLVRYWRKLVLSRHFELSRCVECRRMGTVTYQRLCAKTLMALPGWVSAEHTCTVSPAILRINPGCHRRLAAVVAAM